MAIFGNSDLARRDKERKAQAERIRARQEIFNRGIIGHAPWLHAKRNNLKTAGKQLDLSHQNLRGIIITGDITGAVFTGADLSHAHFMHVVAAHEVTLRGTKLDEVSLRSVDLTGADLSPEGNVPVSLLQASCSDSIFDRANLTGAVVGQTTQFLRTRFYRTTMSGVDLSLPQFVMSRDPKDHAEALINAMRTAELDERQQEYIRGLKKQFNLG